VKARPTSDRVLIERLLPSVNTDPRDRISAWGEWYASGGESSVLAFVRVKNDTSEPDMDILQEAMITAYQEVERGRYEPRAGVSFAAYVKGIAYNKIREARRRTRRFVPLDDTPEYLFQSDTRLVDAVIERQEQQATLRHGLTRLSPCRRQVLERYLKGHSTAEIADALGMSEASVRQHKSRGLRTLRQMALV
jgi:RNA polymerase sigma factor (sigma-70 family)